MGLRMLSTNVPDLELIMSDKAFNQVRLDGMLEDLLCS